MPKNTSTPSQQEETQSQESTRERRFAQLKQKRASAQQKSVNFPPAGELVEEHGDKRGSVIIDEEALKAALEAEAAKPKPLVDPYVAAEHKSYRSEQKADLRQQEGYSKATATEGLRIPSSKQKPKSKYDDDNGFDDRRSYASQLSHTSGSKTREDERTILAAYMDQGDELYGVERGKRGDSLTSQDDGTVMQNGRKYSTTSGRIISDKRTEAPTESRKSIDESSGDTPPPSTNLKGIPRSKSFSSVVSGKCIIM